MEKILLIKLSEAFFKKFIKAITGHPVLTFIDID